MIKCDICHSSHRFFCATIYGITICQYCNCYLKHHGVNVHGKTQSRLVGGPRIWRKIFERIDRIKAVINDTHILLYEYYLYEYPPDWEMRCKLVKKRDGYACTKCHRTGGSELLVHHIVPVNRGGLHFLWNLVTLCIDCHNEQHPLLRDKIEEQQEARKEILCPKHQVNMKRVKIIWGEIDLLLENKDVIYGGCCVIINHKGKELQYGYVCDLCKHEGGDNPEEEISFEYIIQDGQVIPFLH
jgi:hypothetical protein